MKRVFALVLIIAMLTASALADPYTFSNGVRFGMSPEEVAAAIGSEPDDSFVPGYGYLFSRFDRQRLSKFDASTIYIFKDNALLAIMYGGFEDDSETVYTYLSGAFTSLYGTETPISEVTVAGLFESISSSLSAQFTECVAWKKDGAPVVWLFNVNYSGTCVMFFDTDFDVEQFGVYDTTGMF